METVQICFDTGNKEIDEGNASFTHVLSTTLVDRDVTLVWLSYKDYLFIYLTMVRETRFYDLLGVSPNANQEDIKRAYKKMVRCISSLQ